MFCERPGVEVVDADHPVAAPEQLIAQVRAEESGPSGDYAGTHRAASIAINPGYAQPPRSYFASCTIARAKPKLSRLTCLVFEDAATSM